MLIFEPIIDHAVMSKKPCHDRVEPKAMLDKQNLVPDGQHGLRSRTALYYIQYHPMNAHRPLHPEY